MYFVAGKTWLIKKITGVLRENGRRVYVTASTGIAAANLKDVQATTINKLTGNSYQRKFPNAFKTHGVI